MMKMLGSLLLLTVVCAVGVMSQSYGLSDEEKIEIVRAHNYYRGLVEPLATNMERMVCEATRSNHNSVFSYIRFRLYIFTI